MAQTVLSEHEIEQYDEVISLLFRHRGVKVERVHYDPLDDSHVFYVGDKRFEMPHDWRKTKLPELDAGFVAQCVAGCKK